MSTVQIRSHQVRVGELAGEIISGAFARNQMVLDCTPGGGKTGSAATLATRLLDAGHIDRVLWVVPRVSLGEQVQAAFEWWPSGGGRRLVVVDARDDLLSESLPGMPACVGCVTTYQAIASNSNWKRFRDAVSARRTLLILDEVQFLNDECVEITDGEIRSGWSHKVQQVQAKAAFTLVMSGTLWRNDGRRVPFVPYDRGADGLHYPQADVTYDLRTAVAERAVLPTEWRNTNGVVEYAVNGQRQTHQLLDDGDDEESRKVRTFLSSERAVNGLLDQMVDDWRDWSRRVYQSRTIVMADSVVEARRISKYLDKKHNVPCVLATSKEEAAGRQLRHFRERRKGQCLVTVAMAYVGFDCPDLTHLAYLSATRSPAWMLQSFARVSRFDSGAPVDYDHQHAFVYAPDDQRMREFMSWLRERQDMGIADRRGRGPKAEPAEGIIPVEDTFEPIDATPGTLAIESLHCRISPDVESQLSDFVKACPSAAQMPRSQLYEILSKAGYTFGARAARV